MRTVATMGDMFTEAQLRTIENQVKADQRQGLPLRIMRKMAEAEKGRNRSDSWACTVGTPQEAGRTLEIKAFVQDPGRGLSGL